MIVDHKNVIETMTMSTHILSTTLLPSTTLNHYYKTLINFKPCVNLDCFTCINFLPTIFSSFSKLISPQVYIFNHLESIGFQMPP